VFGDHKRAYFYLEKDPPIIAIDSETVEIVDDAKVGCGGNETSVPEGCFKLFQGEDLLSLIRQVLEEVGVRQDL
jgi:hypothetical protein